MSPRRRYDWAETLAAARVTFREAPWPDTEDAIAGEFAHDPQRVVDAIDQLAGEISRGVSVRSPWAVLRKRLAHRSPTVVVDPRTSKTLAEKRALAFIANIGGAITDEYELVDALYGRGEALEPYADDADLRNRVIRAWREVRDASLARQEPL